MYKYDKESVNQAIEAYEDEKNGVKKGEIILIVIYLIISCVPLISDNVKLFFSLIFLCIAIDVMFSDSIHKIILKIIKKMNNDTKKIGFYNGYYIFENYSLERLPKEKYMIYEDADIKKWEYELSLYLFGKKECTIQIPERIYENLKYAKENHLPLIISEEDYKNCTYENIEYNITN